MVSADLTPAGDAAVRLALKAAELRRERDEVAAALDRLRADVSALVASPDDEQEWELYDCEWHDCDGCEEPHLTEVAVVWTRRLQAVLDGQPAPKSRAHEGCDCTELCEMGPTCPGGMLARLPGSGCWRVTP